VIIPEKIPSTVSKGVHQVFSGLQNLPDDYLVYYEHLIDPHGPDFIIISPNLGLLVIEIRSWYPGHIRVVSKDSIRIEDNNPRTEVNPLLHARQYLDSITHRSTTHLFYSTLLSQDGTQERFRFPVGILLLLPNCTTSQITNHRLGNLHTVFNPEHTICRESLKGIEKWVMVDLIFFLRSGMCTHGRHIQLTCEQVQLIRAIIHPAITIDVPEPDGMKQKHRAAPSLKILDCPQEKKLYQISPHHQILYGPAGSGKTTILIARAKHLHNRHEEYHALVLCYSSLLCSRLQKACFRYPHIQIHTFETWAEKLGISRRTDEKRAESDQELGNRLFQAITRLNGDSQAFDEVFIDEGDQFSPSWFQCAREILKNPDQGDLFIVIDGQKGFRGPGGISWKKLGIHIRDHITRQGSIPEERYKNTREILNLARLFLLPEAGEDEQYKKLVLACDCSIRSGLRPLLIWNTSHESQAEYVVFLIQRLLGSLKSVQYLSGIRPDDIAILYPYAEGGDLNTISAMIATIERFCAVQWVSENLTTHDRISLPGVKVHDCHSINGMNYRVVMILFAENFERFFQDSKFFSDRNLLFIALTRPLDYLTIQYTNRTDIIRKILDSGYADEFIGK
jgi:thymidine kinase